MTHKELYNDTVAFLRELIRVPSFSRQEEGTARIIEEWLREKLSADSSGRENVGADGKVSSGAGTAKTDPRVQKHPAAEMEIRRHGNNVWIRNLNFDPAKPAILLCSHHDTVRPNGAWTRDPFDPTIEDNKLYGLGSNDAGASAVSMAAVFRHFYDRSDLKYNLILALVGEEEISGPGGVRSILPEMRLGDNPADFAIVGEPTGMRLAIAEKGLMVLDCTAHGRSGHAAREEGDNAIYHAIKDIEWFRTYHFTRKSPLFGEVKMSVTIISAGTGHNVVPAECRFTVDCRVTEQYTNEQVLEIVRRHVTSDVVPRSLHLRSSSISFDHPIVQAGKALGLDTFGSPTTSDQVALTMIPSVKIGPGNSARSHTADEYIELTEIEQGIEMYIKLLDKILL